MADGPDRPDHQVCAGNCRCRCLRWPDPPDRHGFLRPPAGEDNAGADTGVGQLRCRPAGGRASILSPRSAAAISAILIDQGQGTTPYQGSRPWPAGRSRPAPRPISPSPNSCPRGSAQLWPVAGNRGRSRPGAQAAVMLQHMPKASPLMGEGGSGEGGADGRHPTFWTRTRARTGVARTSCRHRRGAGADRPPRLRRPTFFASVPRGMAARFFRRPAGSISAAPARIRAGVRTPAVDLLGPTTSATMTTDDGRCLPADCQFCGAHYEFDPATLGFEGDEGPRRGRRRWDAGLTSTG